MNQRRPERLLGYLQEAVQFRSTVAPFELCRDSQTQWLVDRLSELESEKPVVLDYGCGNLRLLNGVRQRRDLSLRIEYIATDKAMPTLESTSPVKFRFMPPADVRKLRVSSVDAVALMNVLHEVSVEEFTEIVETVRRALRPTGKLLLVDMAMLPEGEYRAVTYYPWEFEALFFECEDWSFTSGSGVPVVAMEVPSGGIPVYSQLRSLLVDILAEKREVYSELACSLPSKSSNPQIQRLLSRLSLGQEDANDLGYLMLMAGFSNYRLIEEKRVASPSYDEISDVAEGILRWFFAFWTEHKSLPTYYCLFDHLGSAYSYQSLQIAMQYMVGLPGRFFMPIAEGNLGLARLTPSESLEAFEDHYNYSDIRKLGLGRLQDECHQLKWPDAFRR